MSHEGNPSIVAAFGWALLVQDQEHGVLPHLRYFLFPPYREDDAMERPQDLVASPVGQLETFGR